MERIHSRVYSALAEFFFDSEKLVVLSDTLGSGRGTGLDLAGVEGYGQVCDRCICGLTGTVGGDCCVASAVCHLDCLKCLGYGTNLV